MSETLYSIGYQMLSNICTLEAEHLPPGVARHDDARFGTQVFIICQKFKERVAGRPEQNAGHGPDIGQPLVKQIASTVNTILIFTFIFYLLFMVV